MKVDGNSAFGQDFGSADVSTWTRPIFDASWMEDRVGVDPRERLGLQARVGAEQPGLRWRPTGDLPTGQTGAAGHSVINQAGHWPDGDANQWNNLQQARFIAESSIKMFVDGGVLPVAEHSKSSLLAEAHTWAGYAYRVMGEHYCYVVFDGGEVQPGIKAMERAEAISLRRSRSRRTGTSRTSKWAQEQAAPRFVPG